MGNQNINNYLRLLAYVKPMKWYFAISLIGLTLFAATQVGYAHLIKYFIEALQGGSDELVYFVPIAAVVLAVVRAGGSFLGSYYMSKVGLSVVHTLRCEMFDKLVCYPASFFEQRKTGKIINRLTGNVAMVSVAVTGALKVVVREGMTVIFILIYLFWNNWKLTLVFFLVAPVIVFITSKAGARIRILAKKSQEVAGEMNQVLGEVIGGYSVVKSYGAEEQERGRFVRASKFAQNQNLKIQRTDGMASPLIQLFVVGGMAVVMYLVLSMKNTADIGELLAYIIAAGLLPKAIRQLSGVYSSVQKSIVAAGRIFEYIDTAVERDEGTIASGDIQGDIEISNMSFSYAYEGKKILDNINIKIRAGEKIGLVGRSGGGKSTLASLIPRFYQNYTGFIKIDNCDVRDYRLDFLRRNISLINQNVFLFNDTVANNIAYGALAGANRKEVERVADLAFAGDFIRELPEGFDTIIGQNGLKLSGGQRQRLSIARALLKDAPILILDEATSALDVESESHVQSALEAVMAGRTTIVIAHRLSTVKRLDRLLVMEQGKLVEDGSHDELLALGGRYASFIAFESAGEEFKKGLL
ncbi:MAG: lipid A export permease/ATP-binding protein MsbA [Porticoccaceae bacterium]